MPKTTTKTDQIVRQTKIRDLNDAFRQTLTGGSLMITAGVMALETIAQGRIIDAVRTFTAFDDGNDPYGEHDFGSVEIDDERLFFKIDYYDLTRAMHSPDAANPAVTERVMTIMLADEY